MFFPNECAIPLKKEKDEDLWREFLDLVSLSLFIDEEGMGMGCMSLVRARECSSSHL